MRDCNFDEENLREDFLEIESKFEILKKRAVGMLDWLDKEIRKKAGANYQELVTNYEMCKNVAMTSKDEDLSWASIQILLRNWKLSPDSEQLCTLILLDPERPAKSRALAARGLYNLYQTTRNPHVPRLFVSLILDKNKLPYSVVRVCYFNLLDMIEIPIGERPKYSTFSVDADINQDYLIYAVQKIGGGSSGDGGLE